MSFRWYFTAYAVSILMTIALSTQDKCVIKLCSTNVVGKSCSIACYVSDFNSTVSFFHRPHGLVASCSDGGKSCKSEDNRFKLITGWDHKHITLIIPKLNKTLHNGIWLCSYGGKHSNPAELTVYDTPKQYKQTIYLASQEHESLTLICDVYTPIGFTTKWFKNDIELNQSLTSTRFLYLNDINSSYKGIYMCSVSLIGGNYAINGSYINLHNIWKRQKVPETKREVVNLSAKEGQSLTIGCDLYTKNHTIYWTFNGKSLKSRHHHGNKREGMNGNLHIEDIHTNDIGTYTCHREREGSEPGVIPQVIYRLYAVSKTKEKDFPVTFIQTREGEKIKLPCDPDKYNVKWKHNWNTLTTSDRRYITTDDNLMSFLVINGFEEADEGYYVCLDQEKEFGNKAINVYYLAYRNDKLTHFAFNLIWIAAYFYNLFFGFVCLHILSPSDYYKIYQSLFVEERRKDYIMKKRIQVLKWWILMSPIFLILMFPTHVSDITDTFTFIIPSAAWLILLPVNYCLYTKILSGHLKRQNEETPFSRPSKEK